MLDVQAKAAYRRRLTGLQDDLAEAEGLNDAGRAARAREEVELLTEQLAAGVGLGGRDRVVGADAERARSTVTHGMRTTIKRINQRIPTLGHELARSLRTGAFCSYTPDPDRPLRLGALAPGRLHGVKGAFTPHGHAAVEIQPFG